MIGFIGGSGVYDLPGLTDCKPRQVVTKYGRVNVLQARLADVELAIIYRHGSSHDIPPHAVNYRANIAALAELGVTKLIASNAVGGIHAEAGPGAFIIPDQIIDYTWGRAHTFYDHFSGDDNHQSPLDSSSPDTGLLKHVDFTEPLDRSLSLCLQRCLEGYAQAQKLDVMVGGVYGCTQGPRLETAAEIQRLKRDGCDIVGMTMMPEAALAREQSIAYASLCFSVNWAAGILPQQPWVEGEVGESEVIQSTALPSLSIDDIRRQLQKSTTLLKSVIADLIPTL